MKIVTTKNGRLEGIPMNGYTIFKGVPYAKPPIRDLRWKAPQPLEPWEGVRKAAQFSCKSMQESRGDLFYGKEFYDDTNFNVAASEDCLYLNIWTPAKEPGDKLPVAFWIHGGAFMGGYGSEKEFDGEALCKQGVILVTINYRLNVFGFLAHPWLSAENKMGISGNYGILDQLMALQWVYDYIESFGGDKENITALGQSAGAMSVQTLISSELSGNMIKKAMMQSGGSYGKGLHRDLPLEDAMRFGERFVAAAKAESLEELRGMPAERLHTSIDAFLGEMFGAGEGLVLIPNIDGYVLKGGYYQLIDSDKIKDIPYLLGSNLNDIMTTKEDIQANKRSVLYEGCRDFSFKLEEHAHTPAYVYYFTRQLPGDEGGAFHSAELWYMFGTMKRCWRPFEEQDIQLSKQMISYWTNFMKKGNPNGAALENWKTCSKEDSFVMTFDI